MKKGKARKKTLEAIKRKRQKEINYLKDERKRKQKLHETLTKADYHPSGHQRHGT